MPQKIPAPHERQPVLPPCELALSSLAEPLCRAVVRRFSSRRARAWLCGCAQPPRVVASEPSRHRAPPRLHNNARALSHRAPLSPTPCSDPPAGPPPPAAPLCPPSPRRSDARDAARGADPERRADKGESARQRRERAQSLSLSANAANPPPPPALPFAAGFPPAGRRAAPALPPPPTVPQPALAWRSRG